MCGSWWAETAPHAARAREPGTKGREATARRRRRGGGRGGGRGSGRPGRGGAGGGGGGRGRGGGGRGGRGGGGGGGGAEGGRGGHREGRIADLWGAMKPPGGAPGVFFRSGGRAVLRTAAKLLRRQEWYLGVPPLVSLTPEVVTWV